MQKVMSSIGTRRNARHSALVNKHGFTLLEVLVAIAITVVIVGALYSTFSLSSRAVDAVDNSLVRIQESRAVLDTMKREIESSFYDSGKSYTIFKLDDRDFYGKQASQVQFTSFSSLCPGLSKITYTVEEKDGKLILRKKMDPAFGGPVETKSIDLMEEVESFTIEAGYGGKWVRTWDTGMTGRMPDEVRISVKAYARKEESPVTITEIARPRIWSQL